MPESIIAGISSCSQPEKGTLVILTDASGQIAASAVETAGKDLIERLVTAGAFKGEQFRHIETYTVGNESFDRLVLLGTGDHENFGHDDWIKLGGACRGAIAHAAHATVIMSMEGRDLSENDMADFICGLELRHYRFDKYMKGKNCQEKHDLKIVLQAENVSEAQKAFERAQKLAGAVNWTRDLVNEPANILGTEEFTARIETLTAFGIKVDILDEKELEKSGLAALLGVARGSRRPARLAIMHWNGGEAEDRPLAFIGKGVVFDAGGISLKPAASMEEMKGDMGGAAAVAGAMRALAARKARANVIGVVGLVENMPDGNAMRPGDIITSMSGQSIEVVNTDAEGRLVLADALWFTREKFKPQLMIDLATLTGAIMVALGQQYAGLFSNDDTLADNLCTVGIHSGERLWRMPLDKEYDRIVDSRVADMRNSTGRHAGSVMAAQFLQRFVGDTPWAHLDIAGTAMGAPKNEYNESWASGFGVRLLDRLVADCYEG